MADTNYSLPSDSLLNSSTIFNCTDHASYMMKRLQSSYEKKEFVDITIIAGVDNVRLHVHRSVLAAASDFFLRMFRSSLNESKAVVVELKEIDGITMRMVIDFMYTASIELHPETIQSILRAADFLQMRTLINTCCEYMEAQLDASNCLGVAAFAEQHNYRALHRKASFFACANFDQVCTGKEFLELSVEQLQKLISSDDLLTRSEEKVFQSVMAWTEHDKENREKLIFNLLTHVRFSFLNPKFILENSHSVCKSIECYELICSWLQWHLLPENRAQFKKYNTKAREAKKKLAFVSGKSTNNLKVRSLDRELNTWTDEEIPIPSVERTGYKVIVINNKMIIAGGKVGNVETNCVECLDLQTKVWTKLPSMRIARSVQGMVEFNGDLYVIGGRIGDAWSRSVEKYDFSTQKWQDVAPLNSTFEWIKATVDGGILYIAATNYHTLEYYDLHANKWIRTAKKSRKWENFGIGAVDGYVYIVGGFNPANGRRSKAVERYHFPTNTWTLVSTPKAPRSLIQCVALNNRLIALGGYDGNHYLDLVEEYNPDSNKWTTLPPLRAPPEDFEYFDALRM